MKLTQYAIEKSRITLAAIVMVAISGWMTYHDMPRAEDPGFIMRTAQVIAFFPGASPERMEQLVTDKLEKVIQEIPEVDFMESESRNGVSTITVEVKERHKEMRPIWDSLRRKVERAGNSLPEGVIGPFVNDEFGDVFGTIITVTGDGFSYAELREIANEVRNEILLLDEVAKVELLGVQEERIFVEYNATRLGQLGLSPMHLREILRSRNIINPGGSVLVGSERISLEPSGNFESLEELANTVVALPNSKDLVYLKDITSIRRGYVDPPSEKLTSSGDRAIGLAISLREGGNIIRLGYQVKNLVTQLNETYPIGIDFDLVAFQPELVERKVEDFANNLLQAVCLVVLVMLCTLGIRTGLVVASLIPMAILATFTCMGLFDIGLDQISLTALIIALGMLVDNAIVMSEAILVEIRRGINRLEAAVGAGKELAIPLLTSSLTTSAAFLPIFLAESVAGEYTSALFSVVTIALLSSWLLSLTMTPLFCVLFLTYKIEDQVQEIPRGRFMRFYRSKLLWALRHRGISILALLLVFCLSMYGFTFVPREFFPDKDNQQFVAKFELPLGTSIERTEEVIAQIDDFIREELQDQGLQNWGSFVGRGAPRFVLTHNQRPPRSHYAEVLINTESYEDVLPLMQQLELFARTRFPEMKTIIRPLGNGPPVDNPISIRIMGRDESILFELAGKLKKHLETVPGTKDIGDSWGLRAKKLLVKINQPRALRAGVSSQDIALALQTHLTGIESTQFREDEETIPITLRSIAADRENIDKVESLMVTSQQTGLSVPLKQVADVELVWEPSKILRRNRLRSLSVDSQLLPKFTATEVTDSILPWLEEESKGWPRSYHYEIGGEVEGSGSASASIYSKLPVATLFIVLLLVAQFNSYRKPLIILLTIPLGLIGVVIGLLLTGTYLGFITFLGVVSLAGIVINNGIVLLDRIQLEMEQNGRSEQDAVILAGERRLRPILLTTATTMGGLVPLWIGGGPMFAPMAVAIIFGLLFATILTLGIVPILYSLFFGVNFNRF